MDFCQKSTHIEAVEHLEVLQEEEMEKVCNLFRLLAEQSRLKIVLSLMGGELCVYHILQAVGGTQSGVSHQLRVLKDNGIVKARREGQSVLYSIADEHILQIVATSKTHLHCEGK